MQAARLRRCGAPGARGAGSAKPRAALALRPRQNRPAPEALCCATRRSLPPEDEAAWSGEQEQQQQQQQPAQPWWRIDSPNLTPPKRRPRQPQQPSSPVALPDDDWRAVRARLVSLERSGAFAPPPAAGAPTRPQLPRAAAQPPAAEAGGGAWAHELPAPETGCLLVARQAGMDFFDGTVVLIAAHDDAQGSIGFILNRPSPLRLSELATPNKGGAAAVADAFGAQRLRVGGPVHLDTLTVLHGYSGVQGAQRIVEGIYFGGLTSAGSLVRSGLASPSDFRLFLGLAGWAPGQLAAEVEAGVWYCVAASRSVVLPHDGLGAAAPDSMRRRILELIGRHHGQRAAP